MASSTKIHDVKFANGNTDRTDAEDASGKNDSKDDYKSSPEYQYATTTTCHGLNKIADASRWRVRTVWIVVVVCCFILLAYQIIMLIMDFAEFNPTTDISVKVSRP